MMFRNALFCTVGLTFSLAAYGEGLEILGNNGATVKALKLQLVADKSTGLTGPADLAFNPTNTNELYVTNKSNFSAVLLTFDNAWAATPHVASSKLKTAAGSSHFMPFPSGIAFADNGWFATIHDIDDVTQPSTPADFMGPTLWTSKRYDGGHPTHMDMLHNSPSGLGIAWIHGNAYVVNDGYHGSLTVYDFRKDHGPGMHDHSDGVALRYADAALTRTEGLPSGVVFDKVSGIAYAVDSGNNRIVSVDLGLDYASSNGFDYIRMKNSSYKLTRAIEPNYDGGTQRFVDGPKLNSLVEGSLVGLDTPTGLAVFNNVLYVSDYKKAQILAFDKEGKLLDSLKLADVAPEAANAGITGLEFDTLGRLYMVDMKNNAVYRLEVAN